MPLPCFNFCLGSSDAGKPKTTDKPSSQQPATNPTETSSTIDNQVIKSETLEDPHTSSAPAKNNPKMAEGVSAAVAASLASGGVESVGFLNDLVRQLWDYINIAGGKLTKEIVEPMFKEMLPGPLKSLHFEKIDLGKKPLKFDNVDVHTREKGMVKLDIDVSWDGNCDIELAASMLGSFGVESVKIKGRLSVLLCPLINRMPIVSAMQIGFINPPDIELDFTGLAQVADLCIIDDTIRSIIQNVLAGILVLPNRLLIKLDPTNNFFDTYKHPLGLIRITIVKGQGFKVPKQFIKDIPDVYCKVKFGAEKMWKTSTKNNDTTPEWDEKKDFILSDHDQILEIEALDDDLAGDDNLGAGKITVGKLLLAGGTTDIPLIHEGEDTGASITVSSSIYQFTSETISCESPDHSGKELLCGLVTVLVAGASNIPGKREEAASKVQLTYDGKDYLTPTIFNNPGIDAINPSYDWSFRVPLTPDMISSSPGFTFTLMNGKETIGSTSATFEEVLQSPEKTLTAKRDMGEGASIDFRICIAGVHMV
ncbi:Extended synaptotagmin-2 [Gracilariopsis chorda]|uniref:Extended synaptotagmin-2 n=1 Tax=Gracilariopsis chorda TaxID=448386 RepID=A0A2V3IRV2_9FLOR|nr:Extended synaptotagmin-2 [Gracilariopsis chorda]|eukprot:PXF44861.1 Extended synaptotagmin-2 [Gracilariopsis chorda]